MKQNKLIAITGGIGSGKSFLCNYLKENNKVVFSADDINRKLLEDKNYLKELQVMFPSCFIDNNLDKNLLKKEIFTNKNSLEKINKLAHEKVMAKVVELSKQTKENVFVEITAPTKYSLSFFDKIIIVKSDEDIELKRVEERDHLDAEITKNIIKSQKEGLKIAEKFDHIVIENNKGIISFKEEIEKALTKL